MCIASVVASSARLTTNCPVRRMFLIVCLSSPSERLLKLTMQSGGSSENTLKKDNGAQLATPFALQVEIHAIGRGMTRADEQLVALERRQLGQAQVHQPLAGVTSAPTRSTIIR
jgi:hypothetical protein